MATPCHKAPRVTVEGPDRVTTITVDNGPRIYPDVDGLATCPARGIWRAVDLKSSPPPAERVNITLHERR